MSDIAREYQDVQSQLEELVIARQKLETQLQENKIVAEEFDTLKEETRIYKLTGNVLLPVEQTEARSNVEKRLEFIDAEIKKCEENIKMKQQDLEKLRSQLMQQQST